MAKFQQDKDICWSSRICNNIHFYHWLACGSSGGNLSLEISNDTNIFQCRITCLTEQQTETQNIQHPHSHVTGIFISYLLIIRSLVAAVEQLEVQVFVLLEKILKLILLGKRGRKTRVQAQVSHHYQSVAASSTLVYVLFIRADS